jgi:transposase-like protein
LILDAQLFGRYGTDPATAFLHGFREKHDLPEAEFLVDQFGYLNSARESRPEADRTGGRKAGVNRVSSVPQPLPMAGRIFAFTLHVQP